MGYFAILNAASTPERCAEAIKDVADKVYSAKLEAQQKAAAENKE